MSSLKSGYRRSRRDEQRHDEAHRESKRTRRSFQMADYKTEFTPFVSDCLAIKSAVDFWRFHDKYHAIRAARSQSQADVDFDRSKLYNMQFTQDAKTLYDRIPYMDHRGDRINATFEDFRALLDCAVAYKDFEQKQKFVKLQQLRKAQRELPMYAYRTQVVELLRANDVLLIAGDTGCGKSTQVPQYLMEAGYRSIVVTQPRRIACVSLAKRVSHETLSEHRPTVGYQIRFERARTRATRVVFMTEGLLLRQMGDADVADRYDVIVLDEVHERHLHCDFLVGIMKCLLSRPPPQRPRFKLILMSATINIELYQQYFDCPVLQVPGRLYPIDISFNNRVADPYDKASKRSAFDSGPYINILEQIDHKYQPHEKGDVLIFLNGYSEIAALTEAVQQYAELNTHWLVLQLHGSLSLEQQDRVFDYAPENTRKCIISTNIAETSVTIDGVRFVIDSGRVNRMMYDSNGALSRLKECSISQDAAKQRAGRAGRTGPGYCYRLYSETDFEQFDAYTPAEIKLVPLESLVLQMVSLGLSDIDNYPFLERPDRQALTAALERLRYCGALKFAEDKSLSLTPLGDSLAQIPVNLTVGKLLLVSAVFGQVTAIFPLAALLSVQSPITQQSSRDSRTIDARNPMESSHGDMVSLLNYYREWLRLKVDRDNTRKWARRCGLEEQRFYEVTKLIDQFRSILDETKILEKAADVTLTSAERAQRNGELRQLRAQRRELKNMARSSTRKVLKRTSVSGHNDEDDDDTATDKRLDIRDLEFRITNDRERMRELLVDVEGATAHRRLMVLKLIATSGFYPQIAVADEFNAVKSVAEKLYHTRHKAFVALRPDAYLAREADVLELGVDDIDVPPDGYFSKLPLSGKHQLLVYQTLLETKKTCLVNVLRMPVFATLLLFAANVCTNRTMTRFVFDDFLLLDCPFYGQGLQATVRATSLRRRWESKLEKVLSRSSAAASMGAMGENDTVDLNDHDDELIHDLYDFMRIDVRHNVKRLLPADLPDIYLREESTMLPADLAAGNPIDSEFVPMRSHEFGGVRLSPNLHYDSVADQPWCMQLEQHVLSSALECPRCSVEGVWLTTMLDVIAHEVQCSGGSRGKGVVSDKKGAPSGNGRDGSAGVGKANCKEFDCVKCGEKLMLSPVEILRHKKSCCA